MPDDHVLGNVEARPDPVSSYHGRAISGLLKEREPSHGTTQDLIGEVFPSEAWTARHGGLLLNQAVSGQEKTPDPLFCSSPLFLST